MPPKRISRFDVLERARACFADGRSPTMDEVAAETGVSRAALFKLFRNRAGLLEELGLEPELETRQRIAAAGAELLADVGLARLSLDEVAARAQVSRATVYRLFSGKAALYLELLRIYTPLDETVRVLRSMAGRPPSEVMPELARTVGRLGPLRLAVLRSLLVESSAETPDASEALAYELRMLQGLIGYIAGEMSTGRLRQMDPILAMHAFTGPIMLHLITAPVLEKHLGHAVPVEEAVVELSHCWLRAMTPSPSSAERAPRKRGGRRN